MKKTKVMAILMAAAFMTAACGQAEGETSAASGQEEKQEEAAEEKRETKEETEEVSLTDMFDFQLPEETLEEGQFLLPVSEAVFTEGQGVGPGGEKMETSYIPEADMIWALADQSDVIYTVGDIPEGNYDIYVRLSKILAQYSATPFTCSINGGDPYTLPMDLEVPADSPVSIGGEYDTGSVIDTGRFAIRLNAELKAGDTITLHAVYGARAGALPGIVYPGLGSILLAPAGSQVPQGYDNAVPQEEEADPSDPLSGRRILWMGSSITYGAKSEGIHATADFIRDRHAGTVCWKYGISATTLVNDSDSSYVNRMTQVPEEVVPDLVIIQLSTNDATTGKPFGEVKADQKEDFDDTTIAGAMETMIVYAKERWGCPVMFYSNPYCEKKNYAEMVDLMLQIRDKWDIGVIDMWNNEEMTALYGTEQFDVYMGDQIHPTRKGYEEWWTPFFEEEIIAYLAK